MGDIFARYDFFGKQPISFLVILPILGVIEKPEPMPSTIEEDFAAHYGKNTHPAE